MNNHPSSRRPLHCRLPFAGLVLLVVLTLFCNGCSTPQGARTRGGFDPVVAALPAPQEIGTGQMILVIGEGKGSSRARLFAFDGEFDTWRLHDGPFPAAVGRNGFAAPGEKVEGDGKSPAGIFPLESVFGYAPRARTRMPYRQATEDDLWVDDVGSPQYNTWVRRGETTASSYEVMRLPDSRYRHGVVIGYNRNPVVKGKGSAIFIHSWLEAGKTTAGCVALDEGQLVKIIEWLDAEKKPVIIMGNESDLPAIAATARRNAP